MKVVQWNVLAQQFCESFPYKQNDSELDWETRKVLLFKYIFEQQADVICLQECDFPDELNEQAATRGYTMQFKKKPTEKHKDGLVILYKRDRFKLMDSDWVQYPSGTSQVLLCVELYDLEEKITWNIYCTHLKSKPGNEIKRLRQVTELIHFIFGPDSARIPKHTIVCGDFNETPEQPCIQLMKAYFQNVHDYFDHDVVTTSKCFEGKDDAFCRCIDYIFYNIPSDHFVLDHVSPLPPIDRAPLLPNKDFPSDHLFICANWKNVEQSFMNENN